MKITPVQFVKRSLWARNLNVRDLSELGLPYELLVSNRYKVKILHMFDDETISVPQHQVVEADVLCVVVETAVGSFAYYRAITPEELTLPGVQRKQITIDTIKKEFTKKTKEIFN